MESNNHDYADIIEAEKKRARKTIKIVLLSISAFVFLCFILVYVASKFVKSSDAYKTAVVYLDNDKLIAQATGGIEDYSLGAFNISTVNGSGTANFDITVEGKSKDIDVYVELEKQPDSEWEVISVNY